MRAQGAQWGPIAAGVAMLFLSWTGPMTRLASAQDPLFASMAVAHRKDVREAADVVLPTPEGRIVTLSAFRGRVVLMNFWATWCAPCRVEMPSMDRLYRELMAEDFVILAVDLDESPKVAARFRTSWSW